MSSKHIRGDVNYAWPTAKIAVVGAKMHSQFSIAPNFGDPEKSKRQIDKYQKRFANPFIAAERGYIDEVIQPPQYAPPDLSRFNISQTRRRQNPWKKHDNIPL